MRTQTKTSDQSTERSPLTRWCQSHGRRGLSHLFVAGLITLGGCASGESSGDDMDAFREESGEVLGPGPKGSGASAGGWSIAIASIPESEPDLARMSLDKVQREGGLPDAYLEKRGKMSVVSYGRYESPDATQAQSDLERVRSIEINGSRPFATAILAPPPYEALPGAIPEHDLATLKKRVGKRAAYTLQIAVYGRTDGKAPTPAEREQFRENAERAAVQLRREGDEAFYYHGAMRSSVTIGVFSNEDYVFTETDDKGNTRTIKPRESFALMELRRKHPYNLVNGAGIRVRTKGQKQATLQSSLVVPVPD
jgi:hypothetical protein